MKNLVTAAILLATSGTLGAAQVFSAIPFGELDVDRDDALTLTEAGLLPGITRQWYALDRDGDGRLNRGEYAAYSLPAPAAGEQD